MAEHAGVPAVAVVVKLSGKIVDDERWLARVATAIADLVAGGVLPLIVHGGGQQISALAARLGVAQTIVEGRRVTCAATLDVVAMGLLGLVQPRLIGALARAGVPAIGLSGLSGGAVEARRRPPGCLSPGLAPAIDLGFVGDIDRVDAKVFGEVIAQGRVPVLASLAMAPDGRPLNVNADTLAAVVAGAVGAVRLLVVSDTDGLYADPSDRASRVAVLDVAKIPVNGAVAGASGGMLPKLAAARRALDGGVREVRLLGPAALDNLLHEARAATSRGTIIASRTSSTGTDSERARA